MKGEIRKRKLDAGAHTLPLVWWNLCGEVIETSR